MLHDFKEAVNIRIVQTKNIFMQIVFLPMLENLLDSEYQSKPLPDKVFE
jgi:hypothetical protein